MEIQNTEKLVTEKRFTDISLVAYLVSQNFKMLKIKKDRDKSIFYFAATPALEEETLNYFNHEAKVDPLKFSETLRNLRSYAKQG
jgi:hypothetical protein